MPPSSPRRRSSKPQGQVTRGKTAHNRLRQTDHFILRYDPGLLTRTDGPFAEALFVDLGYGAEPFTTLESAARFRRLNPELGVLGVEIEPQRVANALPYSDERTAFRLGGFNLPLLPAETVRLVRAFNVLRQYEEKDVRPAWGQIAEGVLPGGLLLEGTSNPYGSIWAANLLRRVAGAGDPWLPEALVFYTNFRMGFDPAEFQTILPKNYIHRALPGEPLGKFFAAWKAAAAESAALRTFGLRQWFTGSARLLARRGYRIALQRKWLGRGWLLLFNPP